MKLTALYTLILFIAMALIACEKSSKVKADLIIKGGKIYTMAQQPEAEVVAIVGDRIVFVGPEAEANPWVGDQTQVIDLQGKTMTPGFIEGHGHIMGLGYNELDLDLLEIKNYGELIAKVKSAVEQSEPGEWILGRGWHQSKWDTLPEIMVKGFPVHQKLSEVSPDNPVFLRHASGHAGLANAKAMDIAGVNPLSVEKMMDELTEGGEIIRDDLGNPTGVFNERAMPLIERNIPKNTTERDRKALKLALQACLRNGITSFHDAGATRDAIEQFRVFKENGELNVRLYVMLTSRDRDLLEEWYPRGPEIDTIDHLLTIRSIKLHCDGALGSHGAWLLEPYSDRPGHVGHETLPMEFVEETAAKGLQYGFQVCAHAIGDRANREVLDRYEAALKANPEAAIDHRFRIEHAQHLHPEDIPRFSSLGVVPAMQAIHMSSDRPWAIDRLGEKRIVEGAYMWQTLLQSGSRIINGTDVPVEPINPIPCFYASVSRRTLTGEPDGGYEPAQRMTREQALRSYTLDAAYGAFEEKIKGSIEEGKLADFTVFTQDIMTIPEDQLLRTKVAMTIVGGQVLYKK